MKSRRLSRGWIFPSLLWTGKDFSSFGDGQGTEGRSVIAEAGWGCSGDVSFKLYHPVSCVLAGESRVKYCLNTDTSEPASQWDRKAEKRPVSYLFN